MPGSSSPSRFELRRAKAQKAKIGLSRRSRWRGRETRASPVNSSSGSSGRSPGKVATSVLPSKISPSALSPGRGSRESKAIFRGRARPAPRGWREPLPARRRRCRRRYPRRVRPPWRRPAATPPPDGHGWNGAGDRPWSRQTGCGRSCGRNSVLNSVLRPILKQSRIPDKRRLEIVQRFRSGVERGERIDQHHLAVEPREMIPEERADHDVLVGLVAPRIIAHSDPSGAVPSSGHIQRREGQRRRAREIARHQEAARRQQAHGKALVAAVAQIFGEQPCRRERGLLVLASLGIAAWQDARARVRRAARGGLPATRRGFRSTIARNSCRAAADRAAIRRDNRRCRG